jgi:ankyrin repeat protein
MEHFIQAYEACKQNQALEKTIIESLKEEEVQSLIDVCKTNKYDVSLISLCPSPFESNINIINNIMKMLLGQDKSIYKNEIMNSNGILMNLVKSTLDPKDIENVEELVHSIFPKPQVKNSNESLKESLGKDGLEACLMKACKFGDLPRVKLFIEEDVDIHAVHEDALRWAANGGHLNVVQYLVEQGADFHAEKDFAFRYAAESGHLNVVKYLVEQGVDVHAQKSALRWASEQGRLNVVQYLIKEIQKPKTP